MRVFSPRVLTLASALLLACGDPAIHHGQTGDTPGDNGSTGGTGGSAGGTGGNGGTGGTGGTGGNGGTSNCGEQDFKLEKGGTPDLLIVQDRSGSMAWDPAGQMSPPAGTSRWDQITAAIKVVVTDVNTVDWGLLFFPSVGSFNTCDVPSTPDVACASGNSMAVQTAINGTKPDGGTPTGEAINAAVMYLQGLNDMHTHYILLATDGEPECGLGDETTAAEQAVTAAANAGIKTIVVGIGSTGADATLSTLAMNGGMPNTAPGAKPYYQVSSTSDLEMVLKNVAGQIVSCSYALQQVPTNPDLVTIQDNNGMTIPRDPTHMNGWDYGPGNMSINFYGAACDALQSGVTSSITAVYGCPPIG